MAQTEADSGESQLRMLAEKSGGRYLEGEPEAIAAPADRRGKCLLRSRSASRGIGKRTGRDRDQIQEPGSDPALRPPGVSRKGTRTAKPGREKEARPGRRRARLRVPHGAAAAPGRTDRPVRRPGQSRFPPGPARGLPAFSRSKSSGSGSGNGAARRWSKWRAVDPAGGELSISVLKKKGYRIRVVIIEPRSAAALIIP